MNATDRAVWKITMRIRMAPCITPPPPPRPLMEFAIAA